MAFKNRLKPQGGKLSRPANTKDERKVKEALPLMCFSFKDFDNKQCPPGQTFEDWQKEEMLAYMLEKFGYVCQCTVTEAQQRKYLTIYGEFPENSDFQEPQFINGKVNWAVIKDIKGQKARVAGYVDGHTFYVVFLDKQHLFYKMKKK